MNLEAKLRDFRDSDLAFVTNSWKESYRWSPDARWVPSGPYFHELNRRVEDLLARSKVLICCNPVDPDHIIGWCAAEGDVVHYVYVKTPLRGNGYALAMITALIPTAGQLVRCSHWTEHCERFAQRYHWIHVPSAIGAKEAKK